MKKFLLFIVLALAFSFSFAQTFKSNAELEELNDTGKWVYYDWVSDTVDNLSGLEVIIDSGYIVVQNVPQESPFHKMLDYFRKDIATLDSLELSNGDSSNLFVINLSDSLFYKNSYYSKRGKVLKIENVISVPHLENRAYIYYNNDTPYKIFWSRTKDPYLGVESFYYFKGKNISDNVWEDFKAYSPFEYQRAIQLLEDYKKRFLNTPSPSIDTN